MFITTLIIVTHKEIHDQKCKDSLFGGIHLKSPVSYSKIIYNDVMQGFFIMIECLGYQTLIEKGYGIIMIFSISENR